MKNQLQSIRNENIEVGTSGIATPDGGETNYAVCKK